MTESKTDIKSKVISVVSKCIGCPTDKLDSSHWQDPLTGHTFNLFAVDLIYILFEVEQEFNIRISENSLVQYGFSSIDDICFLVQDALGHI